jgi:hypothetical protein
MPEREGCDQHDDEVILDGKGAKQADELASLSPRVFLPTYSPPGRHAVRAIRATHPSRSSMRTDMFGETVGIEAGADDIPRLCEPRA